MSALAWIIISSGCAVLEILLSSFWFIWLAVAGLFTALGVKLGLMQGSITQVAAFMVLSAIFLLLIRPFALRWIKKRAQY